ncbi:unnamed protein product [Clonostachys solani]|uniref:Uncharacterized protein n=1 Tax=Clonostachys solani TaxID=160281 RepID=A0A9N9Z2N7_9HYPO|nr:unnamed protein product [Clonostachys solani]
MRGVNLPGNDEAEASSSGAGSNHREEILKLASLLIEEKYFWRESYRSMILGEIEHRSHYGKIPEYFDPAYTSLDIYSSHQPVEPEECSDPVALFEACHRDHAETALKFQYSQKPNTARDHDSREHFDSLFVAGTNRAFCDSFWSSRFTHSFTSLRSIEIILPLDDGTRRYKLSINNKAAYTTLARLMPTHKIPSHGLRLLQRTMALLSTAPGNSAFKGRTPVPETDHACETCNHNQAEFLSRKHVGMAGATATENMLHREESGLILDGDTARALEGGQGGHHRSPEGDSSFGVAF